MYRNSGPSTRNGGGGICGLLRTTCPSQGILTRLDNDTSLLAITMTLTTIPLYTLNLGLSDPRDDRSEPISHPLCPGRGSTNPRVGRSRSTGADGPGV